MTHSRKRYVWPAFASIFIAGSGQVLKGEAKKGLKLMIWFYMGLPVLIFGMFLLNPYLFLMAFAAVVVIYPVFWALNVIDAYSSQVTARSRG